jgi:cytochrome c biogenesis protein CcmG/thiol:disulfide interchange protein DsbE
MRIWLVLLSLLLTSCSTQSDKSATPVDSLAPCSSIKTTTSANDGMLLECLDSDDEMSINSIAGPVVILVWASWCTNCAAQRKNFIKLHEEAGNLLQVVGVDVEERSKSIGYNHALENGLAFPQLYDPDGRSTNYFGPGVPITQFINKDGVLTFQKVGPIFTYEEMQDLVKEYLEIDIG